MALLKRSILTLVMACSGLLAGCGVEPGDSQESSPAEQQAAVFGDNGFGDNGFGDNGFGDNGFGNSGFQGLATGFDVMDDSTGTWRTWCDANSGCVDMMTYLVRVAQASNHTVPVRISGVVQNLPGTFGLATAWANGGNATTADYGRVSVALGALYNASGAHITVSYADGEAIVGLGSTERTAAGMLWESLFYVPKSTSGLFNATPANRIVYVIPASAYMRTGEFWRGCSAPLGGSCANGHLVLPTVQSGSLAITYSSDGLKRVVGFSFRDGAGVTQNITTANYYIGSVFLQSK